MLSVAPPQSNAMLLLVIGPAVRLETTLGGPMSLRLTIRTASASTSPLPAALEIATFRDAGGFDETFFAYYEDVDLGFRARLAGYACKYVPSAVVRHAGSATAASDWIRLSAFHATANRWSTIVKDAPTRLLVRNCAAIGFGELVFLVRSAAVGQLPHVFAAYRHVFRSRARLRVKRRAIQSLRRYDDPCFRVLLQRRLPPLRMSLQRLRRPATPPR